MAIEANVMAVLGMADLFMLDPRNPEPIQTTPAWDGSTPQRIEELSAVLRSWFRGARSGRLIRRFQKTSNAGAISRPRTSLREMV
jgi:hypothetical protein